MTDADSFFKALAFLNACIRFMENQVAGLKFKPFKPHAVDFKSMWCACMQGFKTNVCKSFVHGWGQILNIAWTLNSLGVVGINFLSPLRPMGPKELQGICRPLWFEI